MVHEYLGSVNEPPLFLNLNLKDGEGALRGVLEIRVDRHICDSRVSRKSLLGAYSKELYSVVVTDGRIH
jgi:hypothetical protein